MIRRSLALPFSARPAVQAAVALAPLVVLVPPLAHSEEIVKRVGSVTFRVDASQAFPGGVVVVRLATRRRLGSAWAFLDGRRAPFYADHGVPRALVPVALTAEPGPATLGVQISARRGAQRIAIPIPITPRAYEPRYVYLPETKRALLGHPEVNRDARRLLALIRTTSATTAPSLLLPPVGSAGRGFGEPRTHTGAPDVETRIDGLFGERHRGVDYAPPAGSPVRTPGAGTVLLAGQLVLSGETVVIDHGQGVVSVLQHLSRVDVVAGQKVEAGAFIGLSGDTGLAPEPMLQWRVYLHGVPVDPTVLGPLLG
jgi:hypothetical protein